MKKNTNDNRIIYLDFIRIFAIFFVIFNHTSEMGYFLFADYPTDSIRFWIYMAVSIVSKVAVPLFFCVSGALLLGKEPEGLRKLWKNRILKMIIILMVFSLVNYVNYCWYAGKEFNLGKLLKTIYSGPSVVNGHLWYLYAYLAFLICLPFLQVLVKKLESKYFLYMVAIVIFVKVLHVIEYLGSQGTVQISDDFHDNLWGMTDVVLYPCIGYYMHHRLDETDIRKRLPIIWGVNLFGIAISCYMTYYMGQVTGELNEWYTQEFMNSFVLINCMCIFTSAKCWFEKRCISDVSKKIIASVGKASFGIYLIHQLVKCYFSHYEIIPKITAYGVDSMVAVILYCFGVLLVSYVLTVILLRIPVARKLIGG